MKNLIMIITLGLLFIAMVADVEAQSTKIGSYVESTGINLTGSDTVLQTYGPSFFGKSTTFTVGALFEKCAAEDADSEIRVFHALTRAALDASTLSGEELTADSVIYNTGATQYDEGVFTRSGGFNYVKIVLDRAGTATDTSTVKPYISVYNQ